MSTKPRVAVWLLLAALALAACGGGQGGTSSSPPSKPPSKPPSSSATPPPSSTAPPAPAPARRWSSPPPMELQKGRSYSAVVHTNFGSFTIDLFADRAPRTVNNFVFLARQRYYDGNRFFRIVRDFMVQTGDPTNTGRGGPGYVFADELPPPYPYAPGIVAMANAGPNTNGSQFFICTGPVCGNLNRTPDYTQFGRVVSGMQVVQRIAAIPVRPNPLMNGEASMPTEDAHITGIDIRVK
jgi:cyclophilin family peptidyl-prolyl cis-trans isomerase